MFDHFLGAFRWYRRLRGGTWHYIEVRPVPQMGCFWIRREPSRVETVLHTECYEPVRCIDCGKVLDPYAGDVKLIPSCAACIRKRTPEPKGGER